MQWVGDIRGSFGVRTTSRAKTRTTSVPVTVYVTVTAVLDSGSQEIDAQDQERDRVRPLGYWGQDSCGGKKGGTNGYSKGDPIAEADSPNPPRVGLLGMSTHTPVAWT